VRGGWATTSRQHRQCDHRFKGQSLCIGAFHPERRHIDQQRGARFGKIRTPRIAVKRRKRRSGLGIARDSSLWPKTQSCSAAATPWPCRRFRKTKGRAGSAGLRPKDRVRPNNRCCTRRVRRHR
jgi:hypothetical protein